MEIYTKISQYMPMPPLFFLDSLNRGNNLKEKTQDELMAMI